MPKVIKALLLFFVAFFLTSQIVIAQQNDDDSSGIVPLDQTTDMPVIEEQEEPVASRSTRIQELRSELMTSYQLLEAKYNAYKAVGGGTENTLAGDSNKYKIDMMMVTARYYKATELLYSLLSHLDTLKMSDGATTADEAMFTEIEMEILDVTSLIAMLEARVDQPVGSTNEEFNTYKDETNLKSAEIKTSLTEIKQSLLELADTQ